MSSQSEVALTQKNEMSNPRGRVYWFTGLSGAGKSTIGRLFYHRLKEEDRGVVYLDGDELRAVFGDRRGHTLEERRQLAFQYAQMSRLLALQNVDVVIATISMFHEVRQWNRQNIDDYKEVYLKVPMDVLIQRDQKKLYSRALRGDIKNVMGVDVEIQEPVSPDVVIVNDGSESPQEIVSNLIEQLIHQT